MINARSSLNYYIYIYEYSCYKTLCQKHRTTVRKLLKKHGHPITVNAPSSLGGRNKTITLLTVKHYWARLKEIIERIRKEIIERIRKNLKAKYEKRDPETFISSDFVNNAKAYWRTQFKLNSRCVICGDPHVQMHHIRHVRGYSAKQGFQKIMSLLNRKQIPVCAHHHKCIHDGLLLIRYFFALNFY